MLEWRSADYSTHFFVDSITDYIGLKDIWRDRGALTRSNVLKREGGANRWCS
jgi:hypothetical protein